MVLRQLGFIPSDVFRRVQQRLETLAELAANSQGSFAPSQAPSARGFERTRLCFTVDDYVAVYRIEEDRKTLTLLEVARRLPGSEDA